MLSLPVVPSLGQGCAGSVVAGSMSIAAGSGQAEVGGAAMSPCPPAQLEIESPSCVLFQLHLGVNASLALTFSSCLASPLAQSSSSEVSCNSLD